MNRLNDALKRGMLVSDGSMGALLAGMGYTTSCPDALATTDSDVICGVHKAYIEAGSDLVIADCFGSTESVLKRKKYAGKSAEFTYAAVATAKRAAGDKVLVACDMGPTGEFMYPAGNMSFEDIYDQFLTQAQAAKKAGADFAYIETQTDLAECRAACMAAKAAGLPVIASFSIEATGRTMTGATPEACAVALQAAGADAVGINCSLGPVQLVPSVKRMRSACALPIAVQPNAGLPVTDAEGKVSYPFSAEEFAEGMKEIINAGASVIGGCCGTTPKHIAAIKALVPEGPVPVPETGATLVSSARECYELDKALAQIEKLSDPEDAFDADEDTTMLEIDADEFSPEEVMEAAANTKLPFIFSGSDKALEAALRVYPGRAAVRANKEIAERFGAVCI